MLGILRMAREVARKRCWLLCSQMNRVPAASSYLQEPRNNITSCNIC
jgi:hypothetical protein